jgi:hypothetical protein
MSRLNFLFADRRAMQILKISGTILALLGLAIAGVAAEPIMVPN